jgi:hypothetical protein
MVKNYAGTIGIGILTVLAFIFVLAPMLDPSVGEVAGKTISQKEWMLEFTKSCVFAAAICTLSVLGWIYLSAHKYPIDPSGNHTQMPYWILHALPPLAATLGGFFILPTVEDGWLDALLVIVIPVVLQYWISSVFFSPNPRSVVLATLIKKK